MAEQTGNHQPPDDSQIDQAFQQAVANMEPAQAVDQQILHFAKQQAQQTPVVALRTRRRSWLGTPWWASAASLAGVSVLAWWLWQGTMHQPGIAPPRVNYQSDVLRSTERQRSAATDGAEQAQQMASQQRQAAAIQQASEQPALLKKSAQAQVKSGGQKALQSRSAALEESNMLAGEIPPLLAGARALPESQRGCIREALAGLSAGRLAAIATEDLSPEQQQVIAQAAVALQPDLALHWQQQSWYLLPQEPSWWLIPRQAKAESARVYVLPARLRDLCSSDAQP